LIKLNELVFYIFEAIYLYSSFNVLRYSMKGIGYN